MEVIVKIFGLVVGTLYEKDGIIRFEYEQNFIDSGVNISPIKLPFETSTYINEDESYFLTLAGVFFDSLPDKFGTKVVERYYESKGVRPRELSVLQKLIFIGKRGMGALEYEPCEDITGSINLNETLEIRSMYEASKKIVTGEATDAIKELLLFMDSGASAGGARAKAVIGWNKQTNKIIGGAGEIPKEYDYWLVKFDALDTFEKVADFTKLEYLYMSMAKACGVNVPEIDLLEDGEFTHFLIKRFDRVDGSKLHMHSLASITHTNFNIPLHYSYDEALRVVWFITKDKSAVIEFYRRAVFNTIARNQDDHAKNTSFLMTKEGEWSLSPAYDITYANGTGFTKNHQMSINGKVNNINKDDLIALALSADIKKKLAVKIIDKTVDVLQGFRTGALKLNIREDLINLVESDLRTSI
jgi:serine/threonine-protein kinase HipA